MGISLVTLDAAHKEFCWTFPLYRPSRSLEQFQTQGFLRIESIYCWTKKGVHVRALNLHRDQKSLPQPGECFKDWGGRGYDDSVPGDDTKTDHSGDRTT